MLMVRAKSRLSLDGLADRLNIGVRSPLHLRGPTKIEKSEGYIWSYAADMTTAMSIALPTPKRYPSLPPSDVAVAPGPCRSDAGA